MKLLSFFLHPSKLLQNVFIYTLLQVINSAIPFLLMPVLTRYLTPEDYGMISTFNAVFGVISIFVGMSVAGAVGISYFHLDSEALKRYIGNGFNILLFSTTLVLLVLFSLEPYLVEKLRLPAIWFYIAAIMAWMQMVTAINLSLWRSRQEAKPFALYEVSKTVFNIALSLWLIIGLHYGWEGRVTGIAAATVLFGVLSMVYMFKRDYVEFDFSKNYIKELLHFGIPLIPHQAALWIRFSADVLLITMLLGAGETGLYSVGLQFGMVVGVLSTAFNNAYMPHLYEQLKANDPKAKRAIVKFTYIYFAGIVFLAMVMATLFVWMVPYYLGEKFHGASQYIYWLSLAYAFQGMYLMVVNYIFYVKKTYLLSMVTVSTSLFHVALSYIMIIRYGAIGAAYASVASFSLTFVLVWFVSSRVVYMPWNLWKR